MTLREYENKVVRASVAAERLTAVIELLDQYYFDTKLSDDPASRTWWNASHENIQGVVGAIFASATNLRDELNELCQETATMEVDKEARI